VGLGAFLITMGIQYQDSQCNEDIALWLLITGIVSVVYVALGLCIGGLVGSESETMQAVTGFSALVLCLNSLFGLAWFIVGNVWVFGTDSCTGPLDTNCCDSTLYDIGFYYLIASYGIFGLFCCIGCVYGQMAARNQQ
jgi:hypothetical protein